MLQEDIKELNNWEIIYVIENLVEQEQSSTSSGNIKLQAKHIDILRSALIHAVSQDIKEDEETHIQTLVEEAEDEAKMGQAGVTEYLVGKILVGGIKWLIRRFSKKDQKDSINESLDKVLKEFSEDDNKK